MLIHIFVGATSAATVTTFTSVVIACMASDRQRRYYDTGICIGTAGQAVHALTKTYTISLLWHNKVP